jgi:hypothetical protein
MSYLGIHGVCITTYIHTYEISVKAFLILASLGYISTHIHVHIQKSSKDIAYLGIHGFLLPHERELQSRRVYKQTGFHGAYVCDAFWFSTKIIFWFFFDGGGLFASNSGKLCVEMEIWALKISMMMRKIACVLANESV